MKLRGIRKKYYILLVIKKEKFQEETYGKHAATVSGFISEAIEKGTINLNGEEDLDQFISQLQDIQNQNKGRATSINLLNINNGKNTIEFRMANGSLDPDTWIENARLYGRIIELSQRIAEIEKQSELSEEDRKLIDLKNRLKGEIPEQEKMEILLELVFSEEERTVYRKRYTANSKLLEQLPEKENPLKGMKFGIVDFNKHTLGEYEDVVVNSKVRPNDVTDVVIETRKGAETEGLEQPNQPNQLNNDMEEK